MKSAKQRLGDVAHINPKPRRIPQQDELVSFAGMADLSAERGSIAQSILRPYSEVCKGYTSFQADDILVAKITPCFENCKIGMASIPTDVGYGSTEFHVIRPLDARLDKRYTLHFLRQKKILLSGERRMTGSAGQRRVPATFLEELEIPIPPLEEQRRIAAILDVIQRMRQLHAKRIVGLSALRQSLYRQLTGQPGSRLLSLSSLAKITSGYAFKAADFCERGVHVIRMSDLNGEYVELEGSAMVPPTAVAGLERFELLEGDILLGMSGSLGKLGIVPSIPAGSRAFLNQRVAKISLLPGSSISRQLLIEAIKSKEYMSHLERCAAGVAVRNVSATQMLDCVVPAPTPHEGNAFAEQCRLIGIQIHRSEHCMAQSAALQASLSKDLLGMQ